MESKFMFCGLVLAALMIAASFSAAETSEKMISSSVDEHSRSSTNSTRESIASNSGGTLATITGTVFYNDVPVTDYTDLPARFWLDTREDSTDATYDTSTGVYSIYDVLPGNDTLRVFIECAEPYNDKPGYAGDIFGMVQISVADGQLSVSQNINAYKILHCTSPIDNSFSQGIFETTSIDTWDRYLTDLTFTWDSLQEASKYEAGVMIWILPNDYVGTLFSMQTSNLSIRRDLPASPNNTFYCFYLGAINEAGSRVGQLMIPYDNGYGGHHTFRTGGSARVRARAGVNVTVTPTSSLALTFDNVSSAGYVNDRNTLAPSSPALSNLVGKYSEIAVSANYSGQVMVGLTYDDMNMTPEQEDSLQMMQYTPIAGDVVDYGQVNIIDIALIAASFGTTPSSPKWNAAADITGSQLLVPDGKIDIRDISLCAVNYRKTAQWENITRSVDTANNIVYGETTHFSFIAIH